MTILEREYYETIIRCLPKIVEELVKIRKAIEEEKDEKSE